jgi:hypothetical protein
MNAEPPDPVRVEEELSNLFGSFRAEWLREEIFELFTDPNYFPELTTHRPCMLLGGRGTGKTTVLRCLSYEGQFALRGKKTDSVSSWPYYGFYHRVNTNRVTAFRGPELSNERWTRVFAHYLNLILSDLVLRFLGWYELQCGPSSILKPADCRRIAASLHLSPADDYRALAGLVNEAQSTLEAQINSVGDNAPKKLSLQGAVVDDLLACLLGSPSFARKHFFFLIDEYENLLDYQQQVVNTLIKHATNYSFKFGVRDLGWRSRTTLNPNEQLISPSDYVRVNIGDALKGGLFAEFAARVCDERLARLSSPATSIRSVRNLLPGLTEEEEAVLLEKDGGAIGEATNEFEALAAAGIATPEMSPLRKYFLAFWAHANASDLATVVADYVAAPSQWETRFENYKYALLFTIRRGKRGIRKYYCGWSVITELAGGNIRYLLELVVQCLLLQLREHETLDVPVTPRIQTLAAQAIGRKNLAELEGLSVHGAQLTKLLLGMGRVFQIMAADLAGHAPEVTQFHLPDSPPPDVGLTATSSPIDVDELIKAAVMHLALLRFPGSKLMDEADTRSYDFMVHPIFAPFFEFSFRRKRKMVLHPADLVGLVTRPKKTIKAVLAAQNRTTQDPLPEQLLLFQAYYRGDS